MLKHCLNSLYSVFAWTSVALSLYMNWSASFHGLCTLIATVWILLNDFLHIFQEARYGPGYEVL